MKINLTPEQIENFPVRHFSPSAIRAYLTDRQIFFMRYVRYIFDFPTSGSMLEGSAYHLILENFYGDFRAAIEKAMDEGKTPPTIKKFAGSFDWDAEIAVGEKYINDKVASADEEVNFGAWGSLEKSIATLKNAIAFYRMELPQYVRPIGIEEKLVHEFANPKTGEVYPLPLKTVSDLLVADRHDINPDNSKFKIDIVDHKLVGRLEEVDSEKLKGFPHPAFLIQGCTNYFTVQKEYGRSPRSAIFDQMKKSKNKDGSPQRVPYVVEFTDLNLAIFCELYERIIAELSGAPLLDTDTGFMRFLPNPFAAFGWEEGWVDFCEEVRDGREWTIEKVFEVREEKFLGDDVEAADL